ncbi:MAG: NtaA/DmoA family FMN-dependent monooxygenase [Nitriliruptorales bacterium]|nr:NtaA/DmoA family FMN-dependent monooxygenase [Nitriliruptorales bacterium]
MSQQMHLATILLNGPMGHAVGQWRMQGSFAGYSKKYTTLEYWQDVARTLERGRFDMAFFADALGGYQNYGGSIEATAKFAAQYPVHDPIPLLSAMAAVTKHLGFGATMSTTYFKPYHVARLFGTLDHLTQGRVGWNIVTSFNEAEAANFGLTDAIPHDKRYDMADEFVEVCEKLWSSWDPDAVLWDMESGVFADPSKVHTINHHGEYFDVQGPSQVIPSPQGKPVLIQAGQSDRGLEFGTKHADLLFAIQQNLDVMTQARQDITRRVEGHGRDPEKVKVLWGIMPIVARTDDQAKEIEAELYRCVPPEGGLAMVSGHFGMDLSAIDLDAIVEPRKIEGLDGLLSMFTEDKIGRKITFAEMAQIYASGIGMKVVGSPETVADRLEEMFHAAGDGFMLVTSYMPGCLNDFVDLVVPILQDRGLLRREYTGDTLRGNLFDQVART